MRPIWALCSAAAGRLGREPMRCGFRQPCVEGDVPGSIHTPVDKCANAQTRGLVPRRGDSLSAIADFADIDRIVGWRPLSGQSPRAATGNAARLGAFTNDFKRLCRRGRFVPSRIGRRQPAMASAVGIGPRLKASRRAGPRKTNTQR